MSLDSPFTRFGALCALTAGLTGLGYSISFSLYLHSPSRGTAHADSLLPLGGGLVSTAGARRYAGGMRSTMRRIGSSG